MWLQRIFGHTLSLRRFWEYSRSCASLCLGPEARRHTSQCLACTRCYGKASLSIRAVVWMGCLPLLPRPGQIAHDIIWMNAKLAGAQTNPRTRSSVRSVQKSTRGPLYITSQTPPRPRQSQMQGFTCYWSCKAIRCTVDQGFRCMHQPPWLCRCKGIQPASAGPNIAVGRPFDRI